MKLIQFIYISLHTEQYKKMEYEFIKCRLTYRKRSDTVNHHQTVEQNAVGNKDN